MIGTMRDAEPISKQGNQARICLFIYLSCLEFISALYFQSIVIHIAKCECVAPRVKLDGTYFHLLVQSTELERFFSAITAKDRATRHLTKKRFCISGWGMGGVGHKHIRNQTLFSTSQLNPAAVHWCCSVSLILLCLIFTHNAIVVVLYGAFQSCLFYLVCD